MDSIPPKAIENVFLVFALAKKWVKLKTNKLKLSIIMCIYFLMIWSNLEARKEIRKIFSFAFWNFLGELKPRKIVYDIFCLLINSSRLVLFLPNKIEFICFTQSHNFWDMTSHHSTITWLNECWGANAQEILNTTYTTLWLRLNYYTSKIWGHR